MQRHRGSSEALSRRLNARARHGPVGEAPARERPTLHFSTRGKSGCGVPCGRVAGGYVGTQARSHRAVEGQIWMSALSHGSLLAFGEDAFPTRGRATPESASHTLSIRKTGRAHWANRGNLLSRLTP